MLLDEKQREAVRTKESLALQAGPGSGKTRTLVAKALREAAELRGTSFRVACVTMSRAATSVIEERINTFASEEDQARIFVGTIHAFCLQELFEPFHRFIAAYRDGWQLLASDQETYHDYVMSVFGDEANRVKSDLPFVRRDTQGDPENLGSIDERKMREWWATIERDRFVDFPSLLYRSIQILREQNRVASFISARFRWILVDEFQDTTNMQLAILGEICGASTAYFLVGDRNQGIYSFAGASTEAQDEFVRRVGITDSLTLSLNYRSTKRICDVANVIVNTGMESARGILGEMPTVRHVTSKNYASLAAMIRDHFLPLQETFNIPHNGLAVIAPNSYVSSDVASRLSEMGIECARPDAALEREPLLRLLRAVSEYYVGQRVAGAHAAIAAIADLLTHGQPPGWEVDNFATRVLAFGLLEGFGDIANSGATWSEVVTLEADKVITLARELAIVAESWFEPVLQARRIVQESTSGDSVFNAGAYRLFSEAPLVTWINQSKGLEFEAVAFVEVEAGSIPHYKARADAMPEERRKCFVAITRSGEHLQLYSDRGNTSPFLDDLLAAKVIQGVGGPKRA